MQPIVNTSPLIFLSGAGLLDLLRMDAGDVVVPEPVWDELVQKDEAEQRLRSLAWIGFAESPLRQRATPCSRGILAPAKRQSFAVRFRCTGVVIDDLLGRRCARSLGIPLHGTLGLVLRAARRRLIPNARAARAT